MSEMPSATLNDITRAKILSFKSQKPGFTTCYRSIINYNGKKGKQIINFHSTEKLKFS